LNFNGLIPYLIQIKSIIMENKITDKSSWAIGGMTLIGVGVGLIFVQTSPIMMAACTIIGVGLGLVFSSFLSRT
jgi:F0F1-type ATP synthase assembly protein I